MDETEKMMQPEQADKKTDKIKKKFIERRSAWYVITAVLVLIVLGIGTVAGAARGIKDRISVAENQAAPKIQLQLDGARQDLEEGRYEIALTRLDWILEDMTEFLTEEELAEVGDLYSQTLVLISSRKTPTPQPSPTLIEPEYTPTPDLRGVQELFETAQNLVGSKNWEEAFQTLLALRENDLSFRAVQVDGMLYIVLRNRGLQKILSDGSLEPGLYDLSLAERFAPLDSRAEGLRTWKRMYLTGASYLAVDWYPVVLHFEQIYPHLPNLRDGTFMTATERFRVGSIEYATQLLTAGEYCLSQEYFEKALSISEDPDARLLSQEAAEACLSGAQPPGQEQTEPTSVEPTEEQTVEPGEEITPEPGETPGG